MKIFGIGLPKSGSTSLKHALWELGFKKGGMHKFGDPEAEVFISDGMLLPKDKYKSLDVKYPDAKFILTVRESPEVWYDSVDRWARMPRRSNPMGLINQRKSMYGLEMPERKSFISQYVDHCTGVMDYFMTKYGDDALSKILLVCWEDGHGWKELCDFLQVPIPDKPFPHKRKNKNK